MKQESILVTGGVGYVGAETVRQLAETRGCEIHVLDNLACGNSRLARLPPGVTLHRCDIRDDSAVKAALFRIDPDAIIHLAAIHYIPACEAAPGEAVSINVAGTVNLLHNVRRRVRFVLASTAAVYAPAEYEHDEATGIVGPIDNYGLTKLHAEQFVRHFHATGRIDGVVIRLFNVVGPGETNPHVVPAIIRQLSSGSTRVALGNLFPRRDYIDVSDAAEGFIRFAGIERSTEHRDVVTVNLGTGRTHSVEEVVREIGRAANVAIEVVQDKERVRAVDRPMLQASVSRLYSLLGWKPTVAMSESVRRAWVNRIADGLA